MLPSTFAGVAQLSAADCRLLWRRFFGNAHAADGVGLRAHVVGMWKYLLAGLRRDKNIIGFDLFNEPGTYGLYAPSSRGVVEAFMAQLLREVREFDAGHLTFVEQNINSDVVDPGHPIPPIVFTRNRLGITGYTSHLYCLPAPSSSSTALTRWRPRERRCAGATTEAMGAPRSRTQPVPWREVSSLHGP
jgi:hypothetical protein